MRIVLDTNVLMSGIFFTGTPSKVLELCTTDKVTLVASPQIIEEYVEVGERLENRFGNLAFGPVFSILSSEMEIVAALPLPEKLCVDPDDDKFYACAVSARCKLIVSGDKHLLDQTGFADVECIKPKQFLDIIRRTE